MFTPGATPTFRRACGRALLDELARHAIPAVFVRLNPLMHDRDELFAGEGTFVGHSETVWMDLTADEESYMAGLRSTTRNLVRRTRREGYEASMESDSESLRRFHEMYTETMDRVGAGDEYYFTLDYLTQLREAAEGSFHLCVVRHHQAMVAAAIFFDSPIAVQYHLSAAQRVDGPASPTRLIIHHAREHFHAAERSVMHLGGGVGSTKDSLFDFKAGFSPQRATFETWRGVPDRGQYETATAAWLALSDEDPADDNGFFPLYRRPIAQVQDSK